MQENFSNTIVELNGLPDFTKITLKPLEPNYFKVLLLNKSVFLVILLISLLMLNYFDFKEITNQNWLLIGVGYLLLTVFTIMFSKLSFQRKSYIFREHDAVYKSGVILQSTIVVPYKRIQHVSLNQGMFSRVFGLASVELFTAGGDNSDIEIKGIKLADAEQYKDLIIQRIDVIQEYEILTSDKELNDFNFNQNEADA